MKKPLRVERDRLRERERQARAQMSSQAAEQESPGQAGSCLFQPLIRVRPSEADPVTQQIQSQLGDFQRVKHLLEYRECQIIGVDGVPPSPGAPSPSPTSRHHTPFGQVAGASSRLQPPPDSRAEFKKPHHHPHHSNHQRGGYMKNAEGKPPYGGRGAYPGQPVKHGSTSSTTSHRSNGILPAKGPPLGQQSTMSVSSTSSSSSRLQDRHLRLPYEQIGQGTTAGPRETLPSATPVAADVDNIFKNLQELQEGAEKIQECFSDPVADSPSTLNQSIEGPQTLLKTKHMSLKEEHVPKKNKLSNAYVVENAPLPPEDEFDVFGKSVASYLRQLPKNTALECQSHILQYLSKQKCGSPN